MCDHHSLVPSPTPSFSSLGFSSLAVLQATKSWAWDWERGYNHQVLVKSYAIFCCTEVWAVISQIGNYLPQIMTADSARTGTAWPVLVNKCGGACRNGWWFVQYRIHSVLFPRRGKGLDHARLGGAAKFVSSHAGNILPYTTWTKLYWLRCCGQFSFLIRVASNCPSLHNHPHIWIKFVSSHAFATTTRVMRHIQHVPLFCTSKPEIRPASSSDCLTGLTFFLTNRLVLAILESDWYWGALASSSTHWTHWCQCGSLWCRVLFHLRWSAAPPSLAWSRPFPRRLVGGAGGGKEGRRVWWLWTGCCWLCGMQVEPTRLKQHVICGTISALSAWLDL